MKTGSVYAIAILAGLAAGAVSIPGLAAQAPTDSASGETISFDQYRDWRLHFIEERQLQIEAELAAKNAVPARRAALERQKAYYDFFAAMPAAERDRRFRERFDEIDANHDGIIDRGERSAWHDKRRAFYDHSKYRREATNDAPR